MSRGSHSLTGLTRHAVSLGTTTYLKTYLFLDHQSLFPCCSRSWSACRSDYCRHQRHLPRHGIVTLSLPSDGAIQFQEISRLNFRPNCNFKRNLDLIRPDCDGIKVSRGESPAPFTLSLRPVPSLTQLSKRKKEAKCLENSCISVSMLFSSALFSLASSAPPV